MKKSAKIKRKTIGLIVKNLIVLVVLIAVAAVGVHSWYTDRTTATATGISVEAKIPEALEIAIVKPGDIPTPSQWSPASTLYLNGSNFSFLANMNMTQVTSDGISFIKPYLMQYGTVAAVDSDSAWDTSKIKTTVNEDYLSFDMYMRLKSSGKSVALDSDTSCLPVDPENPSATSLPDFYETVDGVKKPLRASAIGSLRMSVTDAAATNEARKLLWIPAPNIYYNFDHIELNTSDLLNTTNQLNLQYSDNGTMKPVYSGDFTKGTYNHTYWLADKTHHKINYGSNKASDVTANTKQDYKLHDTVTIGTLNKNLKTLATAYNNSTYNGYVYDKCRFNFWFEGEDPEARAAQVGGTFKAVLHLSLV